MTRGPEGGGSRSNGAITHSSERHTICFERGNKLLKKKKNNVKNSPEGGVLSRHLVLMPVLNDCLAVRSGLQHAVQSLADVKGGGAVAIGQG